MTRVLTWMIAASCVASAQWTVQSSGTDASLRGISGVSRELAWASGAKGTVLRTIDGGKTWTRLSVPGAEALDFRDIEAFDGSTALMMSAGPGEASQIYRTTDGGQHWRLLYRNRDAQGFFDAIAFRDRRNGLLVGDPVDGRLVVMRTTDGGKRWHRVGAVPMAEEGEGAFAASGTCLIVRGRHAWIGTGGVRGARVYRSEDSGRTWTVSSAPMRHDEPGSGVFSIAFVDDLHGIAVGGDYKKPSERKGNVAVTSDGGRTWTTPRGSPYGYRSAVIARPGLAISTGVTGTDISRDAGESWTSAVGRGYHALSFAGAKTVFAVGDKGAIGRLELP